MYFYRADSPSRLYKPLSQTNTCIKEMLSFLSANLSLNDFIDNEYKVYDLAFLLNFIISCCCLCLNYYKGPFLC